MYIHTYMYLQWKFTHMGVFDIPEIEFERRKIDETSVQL